MLQLFLTLSLLLNPWKAFFWHHFWWPLYTLWCLEKPKTNVYDYTRNLRNIAMRLADPPMHRPRGTTDIVRCGKMSFAHMVT